MEIWNRSDAPAFDFCFKTHGIGEWEKEPKEKWIFMLYDDADFKHAYGPLYHFWLEAYSGKGVDAVVLQDTERGGKIWHIAEQIVEFVSNLGGTWAPYRTISAIRTDKINDLANAINKLCIDLIVGWIKNYRLVKEAHDKTFMLGMQSARKYQLFDLFDFSENLRETSVSAKIKKDLNTLQEAINEAVFAEYHGSHERAYGLDFPKNTLWDEFLAIFVLSCEIFK